MQPEERDKAYLWDMLDAAKAIMSFTDALSEQYLRDRKVQMAVERATQLLEKLRAKYPTRRRPGSLPFPGNPSSHSVMSLPMSTVRLSKTGSGPW